MANVEYVREGVDYLVESDGVGWTVRESRPVGPRFSTREEAIRAAARAARQGKQAGFYTKVLVTLAQRAGLR